MSDMISEMLGMHAPYFVIAVTQEQKEYARRLVEFSIANHPVTDIFSNDLTSNAANLDFDL